MTQLVLYEEACRALEAAHRVDEVKDIRDKAEAMAAYARQAKNTQLIQYATEIKVRAERRCGELLTTTPRNKGATVEGGMAVERHDTHNPTLADMGLTRDESSRYQSLASMSSEHFETAVATAKATAGEVTTAFMLREAGKHKPQKKIGKADKRRLEEIKASQQRGVSMLTTYARLTLTALRAQESFSQAETEILCELRDALQNVSGS